MNSAGIERAVVTSWRRRHPGTTSNFGKAGTHNSRDIGKSVDEESTTSLLLNMSSTTEPEQKRALTKRSVVSCFIYRVGDGGTKQVALFRRSDRVRTYQ
jgi:hypothetical protein